MPHQTFYSHTKKKKPCEQAISLFNQHAILYFIFFLNIPSTRIYIYLLILTFSWNLISQIIWNVNLRKYLCIISNSQGYTWNHIIVCHIIRIFPLANQYCHPLWRWRAIIISYSIMLLSFKKNLKPSMYFIKSFSVIAHIFGICKVYSHHWFLIFIYVSHIWI